MDQYCIPLPDGRSLELSVRQLRRLARGLGDRKAVSRYEGDVPPIVQALCKLPPDQRADAIAVALMRFGEKQDVETIALQRHLSTWEVRQFEEQIRTALIPAPAPRPRAAFGIAPEMEEYAAARAMYG